MTLSDTLQGVATRLKELWPDRKVYVDEIPRNADGSFFVGFTEIDQNKKLDRRHRRTLGMEVLYFRKVRDTLAFLEWSEQMLDEFRTIGLGTASVRLINRKVRDDTEGQFYQFLFDAVFLFVETEQSEDGTMEQIETKEQVKGAT